jgi:hypothetical protein
MTTTVNKAWRGLDASNYPPNMGKVWEDEEVQKLLISIQKKRSMETIAMDHQRTVGGIRSQIRKLAADYHFNDQRPMEEIQRYTGLTKEEIEDAIQRRAYRDSIRTKRTNPTTVGNAGMTEGNEPIPNLKEMFAILKDIQQKLTVLLEKVS